MVSEMRVRILVGGLSFFAVAMMAAVAPLVAQAHSPNLQKPCTTSGTAGPDFLAGTSGPDVICGRGGDDTISGGGGNDIIRGGGGSDRLQGDAGKDVVMGQGGDDWIWVRDWTHDHALGGKGYDRYRKDPRDVLRGIEAAM
jgi:Ca2+-binding RTX toxin-like protein